MQPHLMIDLETWSTDHNAELRSIALVFFDPQERTGFWDLVASGFYANVSYDGEAMAPHRYNFLRDDRTVKWWNSQSKEARKAFEDPAPISAYLAVDAAAKLCAKHRPAAVWAKSPSFDCTILNHHFDTFDIGRPWHFRDERDVRTIQQWYGMADVHPAGMVPHNALHDAAAQAMLIQKIYSAYR